MREDGLTTLMVTHNMEQALRMGDRTIMMHGGKIVLDIRGPPEEDDGGRLVDRFAQVREPASWTTGCSSANGLGPAKALAGRGTGRKSGGE